MFSFDVFNGEITNHDQGWVKFRWPLPVKARAREVALKDAHDVQAGEDQQEKDV